MIKEKLGTARFVICAISENPAAPIIPSTLPSTLVFNGVGAKELQAFVDALCKTIVKLQRIDLERAKAKKSAAQAIDVDK